MHKSHAQMFLFFVHLCSVDLNGKRTTFWMYKILPRYADCHIAETEKPESVSRELYIATHVRSDALEAPINEHPIEDERLGGQRKRGVYNVSASTASSQA